MKLKYIVAAVGLLASAASHAALVLPNFTGDGELALVVYDSNASYTLDLGVSFNQFLANANTSSTLATLGSTNWSSFVSAEGSNSANWLYAVIDANAGTGTTTAVLSTISPDYQGNVIGQFTSNDTQTAVDQFADYYNQVNATGTHRTQANGDSYNLTGTPAYFLTKQTDTFNGVLFSNSNALGTASPFETVTRVRDGNADPIERILPGTINLTNGSYVLSYTVAAVPEASGYAMALAGFGALGFIGYRRRDAS